MVAYAGFCVESLIMIWKVYFCVNNSVVLMYRKRLYGKATG